MDGLSKQYGMCRGETGEMALKCLVLVVGYGLDTYIPVKISSFPVLAGVVWQDAEASRGCC